MLLPTNRTWNWAVTDCQGNVLMMTVVAMMITRSMLTTKMIIVILIEIVIAIVGVHKH